MNTRSLITRALCAAVLGTSVSACDKNPGEPANSNVTVSVTVSRTAFRPAEGTVIRVTTTNRGKSSIIVPAAECQTPFEVSSGTTTIVPAEMLNCIAIYQRRALRPGESVTDERTWHGSDENWAVELKAGDYQIRGKIFVDDQPVVSTPVSVTLLSP